MEQIDQILISVIIPEYCGKHKIDKCLERLDEQSFRDFEVLIIDDCSPDDSLEYISNKVKKLKNCEKFKVIRSEVNGRAGKARNDGVKLSKGKYITFIDQDDYPDDRMLELLWNASQNGTVDCIVCNVIDKNGSSYNRPSLNTKGDFINTQKEFIQKCGYVFAMLIKKEIVIANNLYFPEKLLYEDSLYNCGLFACVKSIEKVEASLYYRDDDENSQTAFLNEKKLLNRISATDWYIHNFQANSNIQIFINEINVIAAYYIYVSPIWWMLTCNNLYSQNVYLACSNWKSKNKINWKRQFEDGKQRGFGIIKLIIIKTVYDFPRSFGLFYRLFNSIKKVKKGLFK